jgi:subtilisin
MSEQSKRYIVLAKTVEETEFVGPFAQSGRKQGILRSLLNRAFPQGAQIPVTTSFVDDGVAVLELTEEQAGAFKAANGGVALHPVRTYRLAAVDIESVLTAQAPFDFGGLASAPGKPFKIKVCDTNGNPVAKVQVRLKEAGVTEPHVAITNARGHATIDTKSGHADYILVEPFSDYWTELRRGVTSTKAVGFVLHGLSPAAADCLKYHCSDALCPEACQPESTKIKVAVIDTGVDTHCDLTNVTDRTSFTQADADDDLCDNGTGHGTHVAGIIGACGVARGLAPNAELISIRVFERNSGTTDTAYVYDGIKAAIDAGVDVINLSLGQEDEDAVLQAVIEDAEAAGILVVAASGNEGSDVPQYPAVYPSVLSVSALGRHGTYPASSAHAVHKPRSVGDDADDYVPDFSNWGKVDLAAPGVAVISTIGTNGYAAQDGTSMACPVVSGLAARLLELSPKLKGRSRSPERLADLKALLYNQCKLLGFAAPDVGKGLPHMRGGTS